MVQPVWKARKTQIELPYDSAIPLRGKYPKNGKQELRSVYTRAHRHTTGNDRKVETSHAH